MWRGGVLEVEKIMCVAHLDNKLSINTFLVKKEKKIVRMRVCVSLSASVPKWNNFWPKSSTWQKPSEGVVFFLAIDNYTWTWRLCAGSLGLPRKWWSLQNNGGVKRVRPREGLGACFPSIFASADPTKRSSLAPSSNPLKSCKQQNLSRFRILNQLG